jgi:hypothetical protein
LKKSKVGCAEHQTQWHRSSSITTGLKRTAAFPFISLWIYTMNRCTLALFGRALLCLDFITSVNAVEAA